MVYFKLRKKYNGTNMTSKSLDYNGMDLKIHSLKLWIIQYEMAGADTLKSSNAVNFFYGCRIFPLMCYEYRA